MISIILSLSLRRASISSISSIFWATDWERSFSLSNKISLSSVSLLISASNLSICLFKSVIWDCCSWIYLSRSIFCCLMTFKSLIWSLMTLCLSARAALILLTCSWISLIYILVSSIILSQSWIWLCKLLVKSCLSVCSKFSKNNFCFCNSSWACFS